MSGVLGIILAAGQSTRMGRPKALLPCPPDGRPFVSRLIAALHDGGLPRIAVVGRASDAGLRHEVEAASPVVRYLENPLPELGQLSSLLIGVSFAEANGGTGLLVVPVDMPLIRPATVSAALHAFARSDRPILRVTHEGLHGHPVLFRAPIFHALKNTDPSLGARAVLRADPDRVLNLEVDDPGVLRDFDYPSDYRELIDGQGSS
jgi:molybdenum cofactor cytidylyltransferase